MGKALGDIAYAAIMWVEDQSCSTALAELEDAVHAYRALRAAALSGAAPGARPGMEGEPS